MKIFGAWDFRKNSHGAGQHAACSGKSRSGWVLAMKFACAIHHKVLKQMNRTLAVLTLASTLVSIPVGAGADTEDDAAEAVRRNDFSTAVYAYEQLVAENPTSVALRLELANALEKDRQWERAVSEYKKVLKRQPQNTQALLGIGTVRRWQGNIDEARRTYERVRAAAPQEPSGLLGLASTYALDHDYANAEASYAQAEKLWPGDSGVQQAAYDFRRQRNPRLYLFWESDLSFEARQGGVILPFGAREEIGAEYQDETSLAPQLGDSRIYTRRDRKLFYTHYFRRNNMLDVSARTSAYQYHIADSSLGYSSIDTYEEYRARYTMPLTQEQVFSVRYTIRPTVLKLSQDRFNAHKLETELNSRWHPSFSTLLGIGWLRDLGSNASTASQLTDRSLAKAGFQWDASSRLSLGAKYITNPDLDNSMNSTSIFEGAYSLSDVWSVLGRHRTDDYKSGSDQTAYYLAVRFVPNSNWWSEVGLKYVERGSASGNYGLASVSYRF
jgi:Flp pilus assembly protein TadD